jgi:hypothetical protein
VLTVTRGDQTVRPLAFVAYVCAIVFYIKNPGEVNDGLLCAAAAGAAAAADGVVVVLAQPGRAHGTTTARATERPGADATSASHGQELLRHRRLCPASGCLALRPGS